MRDRRNLLASLTFMTLASPLFAQTSLAEQSFIMKQGQVDCTTTKLECTYMPVYRTDGLLKNAICDELTGTPTCDQDIDKIRWDSTYKVLWFKGNTPEENQKIIDAIHDQDRNFTLPDRPSVKIEIAFKEMTSSSLNTFQASLATALPGGSSGLGIGAGGITIPVGTVMTNPVSVSLTLAGSKGEVRDSGAFTASLHNLETLSGSGTSENVYLNTAVTPISEKTGLVPSGTLIIDPNGQDKVTISGFSVTRAVKTNEANSLMKSVIVPITNLTLNLGETHIVAEEIETTETSNKSVGLINFGKSKSTESTYLVILVTATVDRTPAPVSPGWTPQTDGLSDSERAALPDGDSDSVRNILNSLSAKVVSDGGPEAFGQNILIRLNGKLTKANAQKMVKLEVQAKDSGPPYSASYSIENLAMTVGLQPFQASAVCRVHEKDCSRIIIHLLMTLDSEPGVKPLPAVKYTLDYYPATGVPVIKVYPGWPKL